MKLKDRVEEIENELSGPFGFKDELREHIKNLSQDNRALHEKLSLLMDYLDVEVKEKEKRIEKKGDQ